MKRVSLQSLYFLFLFTIFATMIGCGSDSKSKGGKPKNNVTQKKSETQITPTIYYTPRYSKVDSNNCSEVQKVNLLNRSGEVIVRACRSIYLSCQMQGSCRIEIDGKLKLINVSGVINQIRRFKIVDNSKCEFGFGASRDSVKSFKEMCVDPFYSVAADLSIYKLGDVVYVPALRDVVLPNQQRHSGYFIVRDTGSKIKGQGRFDFFTGYFGLSKDTNPFVEIGLGDKSTSFEYFLIEGDEAESVRKERNFPYLAK